MLSRYFIDAGLPPLLIAACCAAAAAQQVEVRELWTTKGPADQPFIFVGGMAETDSGTVVISDSRAGVLFGIESGGENRGLVARSGDGPGEVRSPTDIARTPDGGIAVYDGSEVAFFDAALEFIREVPLEARVYNAKGFAVLPGGNFLLSGGSPGREHSLYRYDREGNIDASWYRVPETENPEDGMYVAGGALDVLPDGSILFSLASPHGIMLYPPEGGSPRVIAADDTLLEAAGDGFTTEGRDERGVYRKTFDWYFPKSRLVAHLDDGRVLNVVRFHDRGETLWEVYSLEGDMIVRSWVDRAYEPWTMAPNGDVLASYRDPDTDEAIATRLSVTIR